MLVGIGPSRAPVAGPVCPAMIEAAATAARALRPVPGWACSGRPASCWPGSVHLRMGRDAQSSSRFREGGRAVHEYCDASFALDAQLPARASPLAVAIYVDRMNFAALLADIRSGGNASARSASRYYPIRGPSRGGG